MTDIKCPDCGFRYKRYDLSIFGGDCPACNKKVEIDSRIRKDVAREGFVKW